MNKESCRRWLAKVRAGSQPPAYVADEWPPRPRPTRKSADAAVREQFRLAYAARAIGVEDEADDDALRAYVLYPGSLQAARLDCALARAQGAWRSDAAADEFLAQAGDAPVAAIVRRALLQSLARRASWQAFLDQYQESAATPQLECFQLNARIVLGKSTHLAEDVRARWLSAYRLPSECEPAFQWLRAQGELSVELVARRVELLLDAGEAPFARVVAARLPAETAAPLLQRAQFIEAPARMLDAFVRDPSQEVPPAVVLDAWSRPARNSPDEADARYRAVFDRLPSRDDAGALAQPLAKGLAWSRKPVRSTTLRACRAARWIPWAANGARARRCGRVIGAKSVRRSPRCPRRAGRLAVALLGRARGRRAGRRGCGAHALQGRASRR